MSTDPDKGDFEHELPGLPDDSTGGTPAKLRVLVVDDEPLGRRRLIDLLGPLPDVTVVGSVGGGLPAIDAILQEAPDVVFLDVQMPDITGIEVVRQIGPEWMPATIFVTAYDRHAVEAFELAALDYLLKPYEDERFHQALNRARAAIRMQQLERSQSGLSDALARLETTVGANLAERDSDGPATFLRRIAVDLRGERRYVPTEKIDYITADGPYAEIHAGEKSWLIRERMTVLEMQLDPALFFRIHRSAIVALDRVDSLVIGTDGDYAVRLLNGIVLRVARGRRNALAERMKSG